MKRSTKSIRIWHADAQLLKMLAARLDMTIGELLHQRILNGIPPEAVELGPALQLVMWPQVPETPPPPGTVPPAPTRGRRGARGAGRRQKASSPLRKRAS